MFGDIVNTFWGAVEGSDADDCNLLSAEDGFEDAILCGRAECDGLAAEGFGDFDGAAAEADVATLLNTAHDVARSIFEGNDGLDIIARAGLIAGCRHGKLDCLVRPLRVVDAAPAVEGTRRGGEIGERRASQHFGLEAAMKALVLAHGLRMIGPLTPSGVNGLPGPSPQGEPLSVINRSGRP